MDKLVTTTQLGALLGRIPYQVELNSEDIQLIDTATEKSARGSELSSEMANSINQIWMRLHHLKDNYWTMIGSIMAESLSSQTKTMVLSSMARRIASQGQTFKEDLKAQLIEFIIKIREEVMSSPSTASLKPMVCELLVSFLRVYWKQGFLEQFIEKAGQDLSGLQTQKLLFSLQTIKRVIREGFDHWTEDFTTSQLQQFQICLTHQMRNIMKIACYCLVDSTDKETTIPPCLDFIKEITCLVPAFQLFNCNLVETLLQLLKVNVYAEQALACLKEIFMFRESSEKKEHHTKIAKKMFGVLETLLSRYVEGIQEMQERERLRAAISFDKQSGSTEDTFFSRTTLNRNGKRPDLTSRQLLELLHSFLYRYVPYMDKVYEEGDLEIESQQSTKLFFSKELYDYFSHHFWKFITFLITFCKQLGLNLIHKPENEIQLENIFAICVKLMLDLYFKLKLSSDPKLQEFIEMIILNITPFQRSFKKIYGCLELIQDQHRRYVLEEIRDISEDYIENHNQILKKLLSDKVTGFIYKQTIMKFVEKTLDQENQIAISERVNFINRLTWSIVAAHEVGSSIVFEDSMFNRFVGGYMTLSGRQNFSPLIRRAFANNLKYILQVGKITQYVYILFSTLQNNDSELSIEFSLLIFSKIFTKKSFTFKQIYMSQPKAQQRILLLIRSIKQITEQGYHSEQFPKVYSAMFRLLAKMVNYYKDHQKKQHIQAADFSKICLNELLYNNLTEIVKCGQNNVTDMPLLHKINEYCIFLEVVGEFLISLNSQDDSQEKGYFWMLKNHCKAIGTIFFQDIEFNYKIYSEEVLSMRVENFQVEKMNQFRERFHCILVQMMKIVKIWTAKQDNASARSQKQIQKWIEIFRKAEDRLSQDFEAQPEFKCVNYFSFLHQYLKTQIFLKCKNSKEILNKKIEFVMEVLKQENVIESEKYIIGNITFWKKIISDISEEFQGSILELFFEIFCSFYDRTMAARELCLEAVEILFQKIDKCTKETASWAYTVSFFKKTFEHLIIFSEKNQELFNRLSRLFFFQLLVVSNSQLRIDNHHSNYSNSQILYLMLREHIYSNIGNRLPVEIQENHDSMLRNIFQEKNEVRFLTKIKNYRVLMLRWVKKPEGEELQM